VGGGIRVERNIDLPWAGGVRDMNVTADVLLVEGKRDLFPEWTLYNVNTQQQISLGVAKEYGLFLDPSLRPLFQK
jgi:hypothetical protein